MEPTDMPLPKKTRFLSTEIIATSFMILSGVYLTMQALSLHVERDDRILRAATVGTHDFSSLMSPSPNPNLEADEVMKILWSQMRANDTSDRGIRTLWEFTSPHTRQIQGSYPKFRQQMAGGELALLLNNYEALFSALEVEGRVARQLILVTPPSQTDPLLFMMLLSKQPSGEYKDCWLAESIFRLPSLPDPEALFDYPVAISKVDNVEHKS